MGLHTELQIHRTAYDLLQVVVAAARNMPRDVKVLMGGKIRDELLEVFEHIYQANVARDKTPHIDHVRKRVQAVELLLRLARDMRFIATPIYSRAVELTDSLGRQATAWRKFSAAQAPVA